MSVVEFARPVDGETGFEFEQADHKPLIEGLAKLFRPLQEARLSRGRAVHPGDPGFPDRPVELIVGFPADSGRCQIVL